LQGLSVEVAGIAPVKAAGKRTNGPKFTAEQIAGNRYEEVTAQRVLRTACAWAETTAPGITARRSRSLVSSARSLRAALRVGHSARRRAGTRKAAIQCRPVPGVSHFPSVRLPRVAPGPPARQREPANHGREPSGEHRRRNHGNDAERSHRANR
jgi:hypothetical protein